MAVTITTLQDCKRRNEKFACLTAYDATFSHLISQAGVEVMLVGDSLGMVLQGHDSTLPVTVEDMAYHTRAVARGNQGALLMVDMPFFSYATPEVAVESATTLMGAGAQMLKLEGGEWLAPIVELLSSRGAPVCAHLGLTPQFVNKFGGFRVQGKEDRAADQMVRDAQLLEQSGADTILLECVPQPLAKRITEAVAIPVIGIGAGSDTDGQMLVMHDLLGATTGRTPRFIKDFLADAGSVSGAFEAYVKAVKDGAFPTAEHAFKA